MKLVKLSFLGVLVFPFLLGASPVLGRIIFEGELSLEKLDVLVGKLDAESGSTGIEFRNSVGASGSAGIIVERLEREIKSRNLQTFARGICASACADVFLAGRVRTMIVNKLSRTEAPTILMLHAVTGRDGERDSGLTDRLNKKIVANSGGKFPLALLDKMYDVTGAMGGLYILSRPLTTEKGRASVLFCKGGEWPDIRKCDPIPGTSPEDLGITLAEE